MPEHLGVEPDWWAKLGVLLQSGGMNDPAFLLGMVQALLEESMTKSEDISQLTARDRQLVAVGLWPIDCDPARPLNDVEIQSHSEIMNGIDLNLWRPIVKRGWLCYERRIPPPQYTPNRDVQGPPNVRVRLGIE